MAVPSLSRKSGRTSTTRSFINRTNYLVIWAMCSLRRSFTMILSLMEKIMATAVQNSGIWSGLSQSITETIEAVQDSIVTVRGGGRSTSSGVVWRPGIIVTVRQGLRRSDSLQAAHHGDPFPATLVGVDAGTDLAVLRVDSGIGKAEEAIGSQ